MRLHAVPHSSIYAGLAGASLVAFAMIMNHADERLHERAAVAYSASAPTDAEREPSASGVGAEQLKRRVGLPVIPEVLVETVKSDAVESLDEGIRIGSNHAIAQDQLELIIEEAAQSAGLDAGLIRAVVRTESDYRPAVISGAGAVGLMQVRPIAAADIGDRVPGWQDELQKRKDAGEITEQDLLDPRFNVLLGSHYLAHLHDHFARYGEPMQTWLALAAYNWGVGNVHRHITSNPDLRTLDDLRWLLQVRAPRETREFVHRVLKRSGLRGETESLRTVSATN